jgi:hypothetical protein
MDTVSQNTIYYSLNKDLNGEVILRDIQEIIRKNLGDGREYILVISLKPINNTTNELIPKLVHKKTPEA